MMEVLAHGAEKLGLALTPAQVQQFETYYRELVGWNSKFNLTSVTAYEEVQAKHFVDSLAVVPILRELFPSVLLSLRIVDVGAGAGMPGLPLKIVLPEIRLTLVESTAKKATFLRHVADVTGLSDVVVELGRAEELAKRPELRERFDLCLARAVAALPTLVELTLPFVRVEGFLISFKGAEVEEEVKAALNAIRLLGGEIKETRRVRIDPILSPRSLVIIQKTKSTPFAYPRRAGLPGKRPL